MVEMYQPVVNLVVNILYIAFPIGLVFMISQKLIGIFVSFVFGKEITF